MEVCGRYHHWMPILVRIVHRDAFLSWCLTYLRALNSRSVSGVRSTHLTTATAQWLQDIRNVAALNDMLSDYQSTQSTALKESFLEALIGGETQD
jgi:heme/copper-type cytochrome/quinol oxidase subunit 2